MSRRPSSRPGSAEWPFHLRQLIRAAECECPRGHAAAVRELTALAMTKVPARGLLDPSVRGEQEIYAAIEGIARRHLGLARARRSWRGALNDSGVELQERDEIERAALGLQAISDTAYFYAGLAFGLTFVSLQRNS